MTVSGIIQDEKVRAAQVWRDLCAAPQPWGAFWEPIIQRALLQARAGQVRDCAEDSAQHDQYRAGDAELMVCWPGCPRCELDDLAAALDAAAKGVKL